jgi:hypothetical protein
LVPKDSAISGNVGSQQRFTRCIATFPRFILTAPYTAKDFLPTYVVLFNYFSHYPLRISLHRSALVARILPSKRRSRLFDPLNERLGP